MRILEVETEAVLFGPKIAPPRGPPTRRAAQIRGTGRHFRGMTELIWEGKYLDRVIESRRLGPRLLRRKRDDSGRGREARPPGIMA